MDVLLESVAFEADWLECYAAVEASWCSRLVLSLIVKVVVSKNLYSCFDRLSDIVLYLT